MFENDVELLLEASEVEISDDEGEGESESEEAGEDQEEGADDEDFDEDGYQESLRTCSSMGDQDFDETADMESAQDNDQDLTQEEDEDEAQVHEEEEGEGDQEEQEEEEEENFDDLDDTIGEFESSRKTVSSKRNAPPSVVDDAFFSLQDFNTFAADMEKLDIKRAKDDDAEFENEIDNNEYIDFGLDPNELGESDDDDGVDMDSTSIKLNLALTID